MASDATPQGDTAADADEAAARAIADLFTYHPPTPEQVESYKDIRLVAQALTRTIWEACPAGPDRTAAVRKVREAVMTANAGIATQNAAARLR